MELISVFEKNRQRFLEKFPQHEAWKDSFLFSQRKYPELSIKEVEKQTRPLLEADVIFCVGLDKAVYQVLSRWLVQKDHYLLFLEEDIEKLCAFLAEEQSHEILQHPKVFIEYVPSGFSWDLFFTQQAWKFVFLKAKMTVLPGKETETPVQALFEQIFSSVHFLASLSADFGVEAISRIMHNAFHYPPRFSMDQLRHRLHKIPAIIVGAGPSVDDKIDVLKKLLPFSCIFASGSSLQVLYRHGVAADIIAHVDMYSVPFRKTMEFHQKAPFFYQNRISSDVLALVKGTKIAVQDFEKRAFEKWFYQDFPLIDFDSGWNGTTFLIALASYLGCDPICLYGVDLCFSKDRYAKGVTTPPFTQDLISIKNREGKMVRTQRDWLLAKNWIETFVSIHSETTFLDLTHQGLDIKNIACDEGDFLVSLPRLSKEDLHRLFEGEILTVDRNLRYQELQKSMKKVQNACSEWDSFCKEKESIEKEPFYQVVFLPIWHIWKQIFIREVEQEQSEVSFDTRVLLHQFLFLQNVVAQFIEKVGCDPFVRHGL
ncbi:MAG: DUF115 domain-containing protein [Parachlamydiales bacterium]|nr:DUF115 domain-containing protein [Parachlamydiales bacterium]